jgi:uncharacterized protein (TIGR03435 family)
VVVVVAAAVRRQFAIISPLRQPRQLREKINVQFSRRAANNQWMPDANDMELMQEYAGRNSEAAFAELVHRHINLVYSVALRLTGDSGDAQDVTQAVFIILAQKAASLRHRTSLTGWLYETTRLTARQSLRTRVRRQAREQEAYMQSTLNDSNPDGAWQQLAPLLEEAMARLNEKERTLLALRFFENKTGAETAALLGIREWAAHKRAERAVEKLRVFFTQRGIVLPAAVMTAAISANSVQAAPVGLAVTVTAAATKGAAVSASTLTLIKGALNIMAWTKAKMTVVMGAGLLLAAGTTTVVLKEIQTHETYTRSTDKNYQWQVANFGTVLLMQAPPLVEIVPTKFPNGGSSVSYWDSSNTNAMGIGEEMIYIVQAAYGNVRSSRTVLSTTLPPGKFDFISSLPSGAMEALQQKIKNDYGVIARRETRETNALLLIVKNPNAEGLKPSVSRTSYQGNGSGHLVCTNQPISLLADMLEGQFRIPIIDRTSLTNRYDFNFTWDEYGKKVGNQYLNYPNLEGLKQVLLDQLGLELVPTNMPIEMLVVEKAP